MPQQYFENPHNYSILQALRGQTDQMKPQVGMPPSPVPQTGDPKKDMLLAILLYAGLNKAGSIPRATFSNQKPPTSLGWPANANKNMAISEPMPDEVIAGARAGALANKNAEINPSIRGRIPEPANDAVTNALNKEIMNSLQGRLTLSPRKEIGSAGFYHHDIIDTNGKKIATARVGTNPSDPSHATIYNISPVDAAGNELALTTEGVANKLGPANMRDILQQFREQYPEAKTIGGNRVTGARMKNWWNNDKTMEMKLPELPESNSNGP